MNKKETVALLLPDGLTLRNFVFSTFLERAAHNFNLVIFHYPEKEVFDELPAELKRKLTFYKIDTFSENPLSKSLRYAKQKASLIINNRKNPNPTFLRNYPRYKSYPLKEQTVFWLANVLALPAFQKWVVFLEKLQLWFFKCLNSREYTQAKLLIKKLSVSVVLNAHQRDVKALPWVLAAHALGIPSINFIYSWDNLPKGRMAVPATHFFVWSTYMKEELEYYYPDISEKRAFITGTPQFEFFSTYPVLTRGDFAKKYNLDPARRWIIYTGDMLDASPFDQHYLEDVYNAWQESPHKNEVQLLFRKAPTDRTNRFAEVLQRCTEIIEIPTLWKMSGAHEMSLMVTKADVELLVNLIEHSETAVNFGSTMAHDFAQRNKSVFYLNYNHPAVDLSLWSTEIFYSYVHFQSLKGLNAINWLNTKSELSNLFNPDLPRATDVTQWHNRITSPTKDAVSKMIENLAELSGAQKA